MIVRKSITILAPKPSTAQLPDLSFGGWGPEARKSGVVVGFPQGSKGPNNQVLGFRIVVM